MCTSWKKQAPQPPQDWPGAGLVHFHDERRHALLPSQGMVVWNALLDYWRSEHRAAGYVETKTRSFSTARLERSGHWANYRENMYTTSIDETEYAIKPMNCPGGMLLYNRKPHSYRTCPAGGRNRPGTPPRAFGRAFRAVPGAGLPSGRRHIFMTPEQIEQEILGVLRLVERIYGPSAWAFIWNSPRDEEIHRDGRAVELAPAPEIGAGAYGQDSS